ncbi:MAG TPA: tetratricopeptide repeat protein [Burkholderiaceae bacterium]|jgi:tetratricopeptide (TPR) repeat protein
MLEWFKRRFIAPAGLVVPDATRAPDAELADASLSKLDGKAQKRLGDQYLAQGELDLAASCYREAISLEPGFAKAHGNLGLVLMRQGVDAQAQQELQTALALDADNPDTYYMLGTLAAKRRSTVESAFDYFHLALARQPDFELAYVDWCALLMQQRRMAEAREVVLRGLAQCPAAAALHRQLGAIHHDAMEYRLALDCFEKALMLEPRHADTLASKALTLCKIGETGLAAEIFEQAVDSLSRAAADDPTDYLVPYNLGTLLMNLGRYEEALAQFEHSLSINPAAEGPRIARGWVFLLTARFERGWQDYSVVALHSAGDGPRQFPRPLWLNDADIAGKSILLYADQGIGDTLQWVRYVRHIHALGASAIYLDVQTSLKSLLETLPGVKRVLEPGESLADFDFHCPLSNLPLAFQANLENMAECEPYLHAAPERVAHWQRVLPPAGQARVGLVWSGNPLFANDRFRSLPLQELQPLLAGNRFLFYSLQKDVREADRPLLQSMTQVTDLAPHLNDFAETAAIVANLDLVITVDTSVAHLAGAMGRKVWIMLPLSPDFRWLLDRTDSPWYRSARLFRQRSVGDWRTVVADAAQALAQEFGSA